MDILLIYSTPNLGGAEIYALNYLSVLKDEVEFLVVGPENSFLTTEARAQGIATLEVPLSYPQCDITQVVQSAHLIERYMKQQNFQPTLVQVHHLPAAMVGSLLVRECDIPLLFNLDSAYIRETYRQFLRVVPNYVLGGSYTCQTYILDKALQTPERTFVMPGGIEVNRFPPVSDHTRSAARAALELNGRHTIIGFAARLVPDKGVIPTIEAFKLLLEDSEVSHRHDLRLLVAGSGPLQNELKQFAQANGLTNQLHILDNLSHDQMPDFYAALDVLVLPTRREGRPLVVQEALVSGVPVVATPVGDIPLMVTHGINGYIIPVAQNNHHHDPHLENIIDMVSPEQIAAGIKTILNEPQFRQNLIASNQDFRDEFDNVAQSQKLLAVYEQIKARTKQFV
ncbi:MAG: glycosyltransferase family 4 protein [Anaerolineae bacterium]|nr:glycosyltransferase family 4 protein [Anaerolineae bacterium]